VQTPHAELIERLLVAQERIEDAEQRAARERAQRRQLEQQLRWFKQQLFGRKSERRIGGEEEGHQLCLAEGLGEEAEPAAPPTSVRSHARRQPRPREVADEKGLSFDASVPVETVVLPNPELEGVPEELLEVVSEKVYHRLCQRPGAYFVKRFVRRTLKRKDTGKLTTAPPAAREELRGREPAGRDAGGQAPLPPPALPPAPAHAGGGHHSLPGLADELGRPGGLAPGAAL